jgi:hypothetical protein
LFITSDVENRSTKGVWDRDTERMRHELIRPISLVGILLLAMLAVACGSGGVPAPTPTGPTATPREAGNRISIPEIGLTFEIPGGWQRQGHEWIWAPVSPPASSEGQHIGVSWKEIRRGQEPEALLLPENAVMLDRTPGPEIAWGTVAAYRLQVMVPGGQGQTQAVEMHVVVRGMDKYYDFYASAPAGEQLAALEPVLQHMLASASLES